MVVANTKSGTTERFDLRKADDLSRLDSLITSRQVTAIGLLLDGRLHMIPMPRRFKRRRFGVLPLDNGEAVYVEADGVRATITARGNVIRFDLMRQ